MEIAKVKKRKVESKGGKDKPVPGTADELTEAAAPGAASSKTAAGLERAAAAPAAEAPPATPTQAQLDTQRAAIELGNAAVAEREWKLLEGSIEVTEAGRKLALREPYLARRRSEVAPRLLGECSAAAREKEARIEAMQGRA